MAPAHLTKACTPVSTIPGRSHFRSAVSRSKTEACGSRNLIVSGPATWNILLTAYDYTLTFDSDYTLTFGQFTIRLRTVLFHRA